MTVLQVVDIWETFCKFYIFCIHGWFRKFRMIWVLPRLALSFVWCIYSRCFSEVDCGIEWNNLLLLASWSRFLNFPLDSINRMARFWTPRDFSVQETLSLLTYLGKCCVSKRWEIEYYRCQSCALVSWSSGKEKYGRFIQTQDKDLLEINKN